MKLGLVCALMVLGSVASPASASMMAADGEWGRQPAHQTAPLLAMSSLTVTPEIVTVEAQAAKTPVARSAAVAPVATEPRRKARSTTGQPLTWAMMILGFGAASLTIRTARRRLASV